MAKASDFSFSLNECLVEIRDKKIDNVYFQSICKNICNEIKDLLFEMSGIHFSICIKQICIQELIGNDVDKASTKAIVRVGSKTSERSKNDQRPQKITDNTSFWEIVDKGDSAWASYNLFETVKAYRAVNSEYRNPDKEYLKYYKSTIVVPIRTTSQNINPSIIEYGKGYNPSGYHYIAFLCADSDKVFDTDEGLKAKFDTAMSALSACGTSLYIIFENKLVKDIESISIA